MHINMDMITGKEYVIILIENLVSALHPIPRKYSLEVGEQGKRTTGAPHAFSARHRANDGDVVWGQGQKAGL